MLERLDELKGDINKRRGAVREPLNDQDELGRALAELHKKYIDLMRELERERRKQVCLLVCGCSLNEWVVITDKEQLMMMTSDGAPALQ